MSDLDGYRLDRLRIDVARNSTDDFNPFHDGKRCTLIRGNPYGRPIALGFQLECLCAYLVERHRDAAENERFLDSRGLDYRNFQFTFADAVACDEVFAVDVKPTTWKFDPPSVSNRILVKKGGRAVLLGHIRDTPAPLVLGDVDIRLGSDISLAPDRTVLAGSAYFLKRKYLNTANAKNFLAGSLVDQTYYIDELEERVRFPELFPCALLSCALLEKAQSEGHDFMAEPLVYVSHAISLSRVRARALRSNDVLHLLAEGPAVLERGRGLGGSDLVLQRFQCFGLIGSGDVLFRAQIDLAPLGA